MDFRFFIDLGLPFSSATHSCREDSSRKVSNNRDFFRVGDDDPSIDLRGDVGKLLASRSTIVTRGPSSRP